MSIMKLLAPTNLLSEKEKFLADQSYNPQFTYEEEIPIDQLQKWGQPQEKLVEYAHQLLQQKHSLYQVRQDFENAVVEKHCREVIEKIGITEPITIVFQKGKVTRCSVSLSKITFKDPADFSSMEEFQGTLNHEVQTHLLRNLNQKKQGWVLDREKYDDKILRTEEGLAVIHALLPAQEKVFWRAAAYYIAVDLGIQKSFAETFVHLLAIGFDQEFSWRLTTRVKRGLTDTSQPGGNTKDICYLEGAVQMLRWISDSTHNPQDLYLGKIFIEELEAKKQQVQTHDVYIPTFMHNVDTYRQAIEEIAKANLL